MIREPSQPIMMMIWRVWYWRAWLLMWLADWDLRAMRFAEARGDGAAAAAHWQRGKWRLATAAQLLAA